MNPAVGVLGVIVAVGVLGVTVAVGVLGVTVGGRPGDTAKTAGSR
jgi:hypothetical protein